MAHLFTISTMTVLVDGEAEDKLTNQHQLKLCSNYPIGQFTFRFTGIKYYKLTNSWKQLFGSTPLNVVCGVYSTLLDGMFGLSTAQNVGVLSTTLEGAMNLSPTRWHVSKFCLNLLH